MALGRRTGACKRFPIPAVAHTGGLGIHGVATRQAWPNVFGPASPVPERSQGASRVPGQTWAEPASCRAPACHSHGDRPGVGGRKGSACSWLWSHRLRPRAASHLWPLQRAWGRGTSERPQDQVRSGEAGSALDPGMSERDCPREPHRSPRGGSATTCSGGPKAGWVEAPQRTPCPPSPW